MARIVAHAEMGNDLPFAHPIVQDAKELLNQGLVSKKFDIAFSNGDMVRRAKLVRMPRFEGDYWVFDVNMRDFYVSSFESMMEVE